MNSNREKRSVNVNPAVWSRRFREQVLKQDPENASAYLGKLMAELHVHKQEQLADCKKPFDNSDKWETSSLRKWLNETFLNEAFSPKKQSNIISTTVTADKNPLYNTSPGRDTTDKVFLLSIAEADKYFNSNEKRKCTPTDYVIAQGASKNDSYSKDGRTTGWWWLRSPGSDSKKATIVRSDGSIGVYGVTVLFDIYTVRPALWIKLET